MERPGFSLGHEDTAEGLEMEAPSRQIGSLWQFSPAFFPGWPPVNTPGRLFVWCSRTQ